MAKRHALDIALPLLFGVALIPLVFWLNKLGQHTLALIFTPAKGELWSGEINYFTALPSVWLSGIALLAIGAYERHWLRKNTAWFESKARLRILLFFFVLLAVMLFGPIVGVVEKILRRGELRWIDALSPGWAIILTAWGLWMVHLERSSAQKFCALGTRLFQTVTILLALVLSATIHFRNAPPSQVRLARMDIKRLKHVEKITQAAITYGNKNGNLPSRTQLEAHLSPTTLKALQEDADLSYMPVDDDSAIVCATMNGPFYLRQDIGSLRVGKTRRGHKACVEIKEDGDSESEHKGHTSFSTEDYIPPEEEAENDAAEEEEDA